jgi:26S proteasome regulatory subunit T6
MDEIDSIGSARMESGTGNGDSEVQRTMLELLNQLDGFEASNKIKVLMATNRIDILDQALLRPGRIDRKIEFPNPNADVSDAVLTTIKLIPLAHISANFELSKLSVGSFSPVVTF